MERAGKYFLFTNLGGTAGVNYSLSLIHILCDGAGASGVRLAVTEAVGAVCGLGADKISVIQMGTDR